MKRIILTENQYKRLIKKNLNEQKIVFSNPKDEFDITNQMMQLLIHLEFFIDTIANKFLYIDKVENGVIYIDSAKYTKEEKDLINTEIDKWIVFTDSTRDKRKQDLTYDFGVDSDWVGRYPNEDIAVVDNNGSATDDVDLNDQSTAEIEEEIDISDIQACKWGKNASGKDRKVVLPPKEDIQFYKDVLKGIGANVTCEKMLFFFAWRSGESSDSSFNPFATTYKDTDNECCYYNCLKNGVGYKPISCRTCPEGTNPGVRNYTNKKAGVSATANTIKARYYPNLLSKLKNDNSTAMDLASETKELSVWGTGSLPKQILQKNSTISPRRIKEYAGECGAAVVTTDCELTSEEIKFYNKHIITNEDNLNFRYWVSQNSNRLDKVNKKLVECGKEDPKLDKVGGKNEHLEIAFALIGKDWVSAGKPKRPEEVVPEEEVEDDGVVNTYGFEVGGKFPDCVDKGKVCYGGINGNWAGSMTRALEMGYMLRGLNFKAGSQKRSRENTASGKRSDHWMKSTDSYGLDLPCNRNKGNKGYKKLREEFVNRGWITADKMPDERLERGKGKWVNFKVGKYRYQVGWNVPDHYDHIHVGVRYVG
jgi:hypothetical protein